MEEPPEEPHGLVHSLLQLHIVAEGNHLCTFPWGSWCCESITETHQEDRAGLLLDGKPPQDIQALTLNTTFQVGIKEGRPHILFGLGLNPPACRPFWAT